MSFSLILFFDLFPGYAILSMYQDSSSLASVVFHLVYTALVLGIILFLASLRWSFLGPPLIYEFSLLRLPIHLCSLMGYVYLVLLIYESR